MAIQAQPVSNWSVRLLNTLAVRGYPTVDVRAQMGPRMVSVDQVVAAAQSAFRGGSPQWSLVTGHIQALKPMGVSTLSLLGFDQKIDMYLGRAGVTSIADVKEYMTGLELWLRRLAELLPKVTATAEQRRAIDAVSTKLGTVAGPPAGATLKMILTTIADAQGKGSCVTIHPIYKGDGLATQWKGTDLTSEPFSGIGNRNWLWQLDKMRVTPDDGSSDNKFHVPMLSTEDFVAAMRSVTG
jgi:hypothetical protein